VIELVVVMNRVPEVTAAGVRKAEEAATSARELIAKLAEERAPVLSGELEGSIGIEGEDVVVASPHALFVEFGTVFMAAEPFLMPSVKDGERLLDVLMASALA